MKLPRWLVIAMLTTSVLSVLAAAGWWWVTWPERTAREFLDMIATERVDDARKIVQHDPERYWPTSFYTFDPSFSWKAARLESRARSFVDVMLACQEFEIVDTDLRFIAQRGKVIQPAKDWWGSDRDWWVTLPSAPIQAEAPPTLPSSETSIP